MKPACDECAALRDDRYRLRPDVDASSDLSSNSEVGEVPQHSERCVYDIDLGEDRRCMKLAEHWLKPIRQYGAVGYCPEHYAEIVEDQRGRPFSRANVVAWLIAATIVMGIVFWANRVPSPYCVPNPPGRSMCTKDVETAPNGLTGPRPDAHWEYRSN